MTKMQHALKPLGAFVAGCALALACILGFAGSAEAQTENGSERHEPMLHSKACSA